MNELVAIYNNKVKCRKSLREVIEFAFEDEEVATDCTGKLVAFVENGKAKRIPQKKMVKEMFPEGNMKDTDYLYLITAYTWDDTCPIAEFNFGVLDAAHMYEGHKVMVSVHLTDEAIYVHTLIKRTEGKEWYVPDELPGFSAVNCDLPNPVIEYCEAMDYLMY